MPRFRKVDWYDTPLYYDIVFDGDTPAEADFLEGVLAAHGRSGGCRVLEPACGSGRLVAELARRGYRVTGFDASEAMLEFARHKLAVCKAAAHLKRDRMESFKVRGRFDLAFCLLSTFKYLLSERDAQDHLRRVYDVLKPGGVYVLGLHLAAYGDPRVQHERWTGERDGVKVVCNTRTWPADRRRRREKIRNRLAVECDGATSRQETVWECRTYDAAQIEKTLTTAAPGFEIAASHDFHHDLGRPLHRDQWDEDVVLVLRRSD